MKLVTFRVADDTRLGLLDDGQVVDLKAAAGSAGVSLAHFSDVITFLTAGEVARQGAARVVEFIRGRRDIPHVRPLGDVRLLAPIPRPGKILCLAGNYAAHIREGGRTPPERENTTPHPFIKPVTTVIGTEEPIRLPGPFC